MSRDILGFFQRNVITSSMTKWHDSPIPWVALILCLCLGSLVVSPLLWVVGTSTPIIEGIDLENSSGVDPLETEDDFFLLPAMALTIAGFIFSKFTAINLDFQPAYLPPILPPPK